MLLSTVGYRSTVVITTATMAMITVIRGCGCQLPPTAQPRVMLAYQVREGSTYGRWGILSLWDSVFRSCLCLWSCRSSLPPPPSSSSSSPYTSTAADLTLRAGDPGWGNLLTSVALPLPAEFRVWGNLGDFIRVSSHQSKLY